MTKYQAGGPRRPYEITLLVVAVAAAGLNLRTAITSLPPLFPDLQTSLHLSSATLSLLAATPVICFGVVSAFTAWLNRRYGEEMILLVALILLTAGLLLRGLAPGAMLFPGTAPAASGAAALAPPRAGVKVYRYALTWQVTAFMGLQSLLYYAALSWLPTIFQDRGDSPVTAGNLLALMGVGNLATSLIVPVLAHRSPSQRGLVVPSLIGTAAGLAGSLWAPLGSAPFWVLVLGVSQGSCLGLAIFFMLARAPDAGVAASLSAFAQSVGYLVASVGPLMVGLLHSATGSWNLPLVLLLVLCAAELATGLLAGRPLQLPSVTPPPAPEARNTTRVSGTG